jgi:hypothetical protein
MDNMLAVETRYREHQQRTEDFEEEYRPFDRPVKRYPVRRMVAKALIALADTLTPAPKQETQTVA